MLDRNSKEFQERLAATRLNKKHLTQKEFEDKLDYFFPGAYKVLSEYKGVHEKVRVRHRCGYEFETRPLEFNKHLEDGKEICQFCNGKTGGKLSKELFLEKLSSYSNDFHLISDYNGSKSEVTILHSCGNSFNVLPENLLKKFKRNSNPCPFCNKPLDEASILLNLKEKYPQSNFSFKYLEKDSPLPKRKILIHCNKCGYEWETNFHQLLYYKPNNPDFEGKLCPKCEKESSFIKYSREEIIEMCRMLRGDYVLSEFCTNNEKVSLYERAKFQHKLCGKEFESSIYKVVRENKNCPFCFGSSAEEEIKKILEENGIEYEYQFFPEEAYPKLSRNQKFDFRIGNVLLEYDGELHYEPKFGEEELEKQKKSDREKDEWMRSQNKYELVRIPYWERDRIEETLKKKVIKTKV